MEHLTSEENHIEKETVPHEVTHAHKKKHSFVLTTPLAIIISGGLIALGLIGYGMITQGGSQAPLTLFEGKTPDESDFIAGDKESDVVVIEYSDSECPFCGQVHSTMKQIRDTYGDKISFIYRHFPLTQIHPNAFNEAKAMECVGKLGDDKKYYEYIDALFGYKIEKKSMQLPQNGTSDLARNLGIDTAALLTCMKSDEITKKVEASIEDGVAAGVQGTPSSFVLVKTRNGYEVVGHVDGARPYPYFKALIDQALAK